MNYKLITHRCCVFNRLRSLSQSSHAYAAGGFFPVRGKETKGRPKEILWKPVVENSDLLSLMNYLVRIPSRVIPNP